MPAQAKSSIDHRTQLDRCGWVRVASGIPDTRLDALGTEIGGGAGAPSARAGSVYGARNLLRLESVRELIKSPEVSNILDDFLGVGWKAVKALYFAKTKEANWPVPWHQDLSLAVDGPRDRARWTAWTVKGGVSHVQAPPAILARMLTLRLHLDNCADEDGPLRVLEGSHLMGRLTRERITELAPSKHATECLARRGDFIAMRPLVLHASSPAACPRSRKVLHLEFAPANVLPTGFSWAAI